MIFSDEIGLIYELNKNDFTAIIVNCNRKLHKLFIPRTVRYNSQEYVITAIGRLSFAYHSHILAIDFSEDSELDSIDEEAFSNSNLISIQIPSSVTKIGAKAFSKCGYLTDVQIPKNSKLTMIDNKAFESTSISNFFIPPLVTKICDNAFDCSKLSRLTISKESKLTSICKEAFVWTNISYLYFPDNLNEFGQSWCSSTMNLNKIEFSPKNKNFKYINEDQSMIVTKSDQNNDNYDVLLFVSRNVDDVVVPSFIKCINSGAFSGCEKLEFIEFNKKSLLTSINEYAFSYSSIIEITLPSSLTHIKAYAFYKCEKLERIKFKKNSKLKSIGKHAFSETIIDSFSFPDNLEIFDKEWCYDLFYLNSISISTSNEFLSLFDSNLILKKSNQNEKEFDSILFANRSVNEVKIPSFIKYIKSCAFSSCESLQSVEIPDDSQLEIIESYAFSDSSIEEFFVPKHVKIIEKKAFFGCSNLKSIKFHDDSELIKIGKSAFDDTKLECITIPANVKVIKEGFNKSSRKLTHIFISPQNKNFILFNGNMIVGKLNNESDCFDHLIFVNDDFDQIIIPSFIKRISNFTFKNVHHLKKVEFEKNSQLVSIGVSSFAYTSIKSIFIPSNVNEVEKKAFKNCLNLACVEFLGDNILIDGGCFFECGFIKIISFPNAKNINLALDAFRDKSCKVYISSGGKINNFISNIGCSTFL